MTNASIIGFITQEKVAEFKKLLGDRFIAVADFPDGVPYAWQDKNCILPGRMSLFMTEFLQDSGFAIWKMKLKP